MWRSFILPVVALALLAFGTSHVLSRQKPVEQSAPPVEPTHAPFARQVVGAGLVEAQTENIKVGTPLAGIVDRVLVDVGQTVSPGQPLFLLDTRQIDANVRSGAARLAASEAEQERIDRMPRPEDVPPIVAQRREMEAAVAEHKDAWERTKRLFERKVSTEEELTNRRARYDVALAQLERMQAEENRMKAGAWDADKKVARAAVERARAELEQLTIERERHTILAPGTRSSGDAMPTDDDVQYVVLQVNVRPTEAVSNLSTAPLIVLGNVRRKNVRVDIDEHDIPRFRTDAPALALIRGDGDTRYPLVFVRVEPYVVPKRSLTGDSTERVDTRVLQVIYRIDETGRPPIYVGQQMDVYVDLGK